jgi:hypothetical protein
MRSIRPAIALCALVVAACSSDDPVAPPTQTVAYDLTCTPLLGATLTGTVRYSTPSGNQTATVNNGRWSFTQAGWPLASGDRLEARATVQGNSDCRLSLSVDGALVTFERQAVQLGGQTPTNEVSVGYLVP